MIVDDQNSFLERRKNFEDAYFDSIEEQNLLSTISVIDINTIDVCNRSCVFCPRNDPSVYPNRNLKMTARGANLISQKLKDINYSGTIAISGFGENLLNPEISEIIYQLKNLNEKCFVECNTNGDPLTKNLAKSLIDSGLDCLNINMYDGPEQIQKFDELLDGIPTNNIKYRKHWDPKDYGMIYNNRSGMVTWLEPEIDNNLKNSPCYYPFYKLFVDWNGDVLFCANDWGRTRIVGNLFQQSVEEVWMSKGMEKVRRRLLNNNRNFNPCSKCSVNGRLLGEKSFVVLKDYYENSSYRK